MSYTVRVLIVDASPFMRYITAKHLEADPDITVVGTAQNELDALAKIPALSPDVITLDAEMSQMNGLTPLQRAMAEHAIPVVVLHSLSHRDTRTTIQALLQGTVDSVAKPTISTGLRTATEELATKIKVAASTTRRSL